MYIERKGIALLAAPRAGGGHRVAGVSSGPHGITACFYHLIKTRIVEYWGQRQTNSWRFPCVTIR